MNWILYIITMIFVFCFMCLGVKSRIREIKERREKLAREGNLAPPKVGIIRTLRTTGIMVGSSLIITTVVFSVRNVEFSAYNISEGTFTIFVFECIIGSQVGFVQEVVKIYKKNGLVITILAVIVTICWAISLIYTRYGHYNQ